MKLFECYDIGGTKIRGALIQKNGEILIKKSIKTKKGSPDKLIKQIKYLSNSLRKDINSKDVVAVSLALPGPVKKNILLESPQLNIKSKLDLASKFKKYTKKPVFVINDMKAAIRAELKFGIGKKVKNFYLLTISSSIGSGLVVDGKILEGFYGEFGHDILERDSKKAIVCVCGRKGCWGAMSGGIGIEKTMRKELKKTLTVERFFDIYKKDKRVKKIIENIRSYNAHGIGNMLNAFSVDEIVIMGSVGLNQFKKIIPSSKEIKKYTINNIPKIIPTKLGEDIGLLGAFAFAHERIK